MLAILLNNGKRILTMFVCVSRLDFDYLNELPIFVLDVSDDFKNDRIKQEEIIDKVGEILSFLVPSL